MNPQHPTRSPLIVKAPLSGHLLPIESIPDPVFAQKIVGDGVSIDPTSGALVAPCDGEVAHLHAAGHALTLRTACGLELMIHVGLDTVKLKGEGFSSRVKVGERVAAGQVLIEFDMDRVATSAKSLLTQIVVTNGDRVASMKKSAGTVKAFEDTVLEIHVKTPVGGDTVDLQTAATITETVEVPNPNGLHARPAAVLVSHAKRFKSDLRLVRGDEKVDAKSVVSIMSLNVKCGDLVSFTASGPDACEAGKTLLELLRGGLGESTAEPAASPGPLARPVPSAAPARPEDPNLIVGVAASPGLAVGVVFQLRSGLIDVVEVGEEPDKETRKLQDAMEKAFAELEVLEARLRSAADADKAAIFGAHRELLGDPALLEIARGAIAKGRSAAAAWKGAFTTHAQRLAALNNELLRARANDLKDVGNRVLRHLTGAPEESREFPPETILIAEDLTPSDTANLDRTRVVGFCTVGGGPTSHVSIVARSLGIPAVAGIEPRALDVPNGTRAIVDGSNGTFRVDPSAGEVERAQAKKKKSQARLATDLKVAHEPAVTRDGHRVHVVANIGSVADAQEAVRLGAEGVGLLRSEFLFMDRPTAPDEEEQLAAYGGAASALGADRPLIIRTLDVGGDKPIAYLPIAKEANPFLGERGIRVGLERPDLFRVQLRAILGASRSGSVRIMFPMIGTLAEWRAAKAMLDEEVARLELPPIPAGIMVEVPSAAVMSDLFAPEVDFFSIGTNDLTQYTLAIDRGHPKLGAKADALDPAVLRLIERTVEGAHRHRRPVGICGGIASEPKAVPILIGLSVDELSVSVPSVPKIKAIVRNLTLDACRQMAKRAVALSTAAEVRELTQPNED